MTKYKIGENVVWEEVVGEKGETIGCYSYVKSEVVSLKNIEYEILDVLIRNSVLYNNYMSYDEIGKKVHRHRTTVFSHVKKIKNNPNWADKIETTKDGSRIINLMLITDKEASALLSTPIIETRKKKEKSCDSKKKECTIVADRADLIGCCYPYIADAILCKLTDDKVIHLSFNFVSNQTIVYPEFISAVFQFYDDLNVLEYYELNHNSVLHMEINNFTNSIKELQIEFQTENNRVVGNPYKVKLHEGNNVVDLPISSYSKYTRDMKKIQNLCFVINRAYFNEPKDEDKTKGKGVVLISNVSFVF